MEKNLLRYIWQHSRKQQLIVVAMTMLSFPILYLTLELPKWIINDALSDFAGQETLLGFVLGPVQFLAVLCFFLLGLIVLNGVLKMRINTFKGIIGERLVRRLRYNLIHNTLRFPLPYFSRISSGELISTITAETEPLGGYIGESIALPLFQGGTMITILVFMFAQDWVFGLVSVALIPVQGYLIPKLQHQVNLLKKERVRHIRKFSERIGETVAGASEIRLHGTQPYTLSEFSRRLGDLFLIRLEIFKKKFFIKFLNNTIGQITPFLFYLFGGYLVIKGDLTLGALVAAIGAYKDLTSPWRELLNFYQLHEDSKIKYQQVIELFDPDDLLHVAQREPSEPIVELDGNVLVRNLSWRNENGEQILSGVNFSAKSGQTVAITGNYAIRRARLAQILAGLESPSRGSVTYGDHPLNNNIEDSAFRRQVGFVGPDPHMFAGSIIENMEYGLNHSEPDPGDDKQELTRLRDAEDAGNRPPIDVHWQDYRLTGQQENTRSTDWSQKVVAAMGASDEVSQRSLLEIFNPDDKPELADKLLQARKLLRQKLNGIPEARHISLFDPDNFNANASIAENILFGVAVDDRLDPKTFTVHRYIIDVLNKLKLHSLAVQTGYQASKALLKMVDRNIITHDLIDYFVLSDDERVEKIRYTVDNYRSEDKLSEQCRFLLLSVFLMLVPERHGFVQISFRDLTRLLQARREFTDNLPDNLSNAVIKFDAEHYHPNLTVKDNLLFGRVSATHPSAERAANRLIREVVESLDLRTPLNDLLGESQVGIGGSRIPLITRHRIALGRVLMKAPKVVIFLDALSPFDEDEKMERLRQIRALLPSVTIIWIAREIEHPDLFDQIYEFSEPGPLKLLDQDDIDEHDMPEELAIRSSSAMDLVSHSILFSNIEPRQQRFIAEHSKLVAIPAGTDIYEAGDQPDAAWLVVSGKVVSLRNGERFGEFKRPEVFGAMDILADGPRIMSTRAAEDSVVLRMEAAAIETVATSDVSMSRTLLRSLSRQWQR